MLKVKVINCDGLEVQREYKDGNDFIRVMESEKEEDQINCLMLDDEIISVEIDGVKTDNYYIVNDLYNDFSE